MKHVWNPLILAGNLGYTAIVVMLMYLAVWYFKIVLTNI
jgi:hypothetical protein